MAGLSLGYFAGKNGIPFTIYEAKDRVGGNCITFESKGFRYDSGAHRFHDKDEQMTAEVLHLMGDKIHRIKAPSRILHNGEFYDFPLSVFNLLKRMGIASFSKGVWDTLASRLKYSNSTNGDFEEFAYAAYGKHIADKFLTNYSEKLWGLSCDRLSPEIAGERLKGLDLGSFILETFKSRLSGSKHMEGNFYYPEEGIGALSNKMADRCGRKNIRTGSKITAIFHDNRKITSIEINGKEKKEAKAIASSLPLTDLIEILLPAAPQDVSSAVKRLSFRNLILTAIFLNKNSISDCATIYCPDSSFPFTRIYEPKNRSLLMSPSGKTSLIAEIPCAHSDELWTATDEFLIKLVLDHLREFKWFTQEDIISVDVQRMKNCYPVLKLGYEREKAKINDYLKRFSNLYITGRNGRFVYEWIHNMMRYGKDIADDLINQTT